MRATATAAGPAGGPSTPAVEAAAPAAGWADGVEEIVSVAALPVLLALAAGVSASTSSELETCEPSSFAGALKTGVAPCRVGSGVGCAAGLTGVTVVAGGLATATRGAGVDPPPSEERSE